MASVASAEPPAAPAELSASEAIQAGDVEALRRALGERSLVDEPKPPAGALPLLHLAARVGDAPIVRLLLERGADLAARATVDQFVV